MTCPAGRGRPRRGNTNALDDRPTSPREGGELVTIEAGRGLAQGNWARLRQLGPLLGVWSRRELRARYRQSVLRAGWSLVQPITVLAIYGWVVTAVLDVSQDRYPFLAFAWAGIVPFTFVSQALGQGVGSIQAAGTLISRVALPREVLPLAVVTTSLLDLAVMTAILVVVAWVQVGPVGVTILGLLLVDAMLLVWVTGLTLLAATLTVFRRDLNYAVPLALRIAFIVSPVVYPAELLRDRAYWLWAGNPVAVAIEGTRSAVLAGTWPDLPLVGAHLVAGCLVLVGAYALFRRVEPRMGDAV